MNPPGGNQRIGKWGEDRAALYLAEHDYVLVGRNQRTPFGEIDLICKKEGYLIFVEVKTRTGSGYGLPEEAVTPAKQSHLIAAIQSYLQTTGQSEAMWQIDVIAVIGSPGCEAIEMEHFENAIH